MLSWLVPCVARMALRCARQGHREGGSRNGSFWSPQAAPHRGGDRRHSGSSTATMSGDRGGDELREPYKHRLFSFITQNWRGKPLVSYAVILSLIAATTTHTGLTVESYLDTNLYPTGRTPTDAQMATVQLERHAFHGDWNYTISPYRLE